MPLQSGSGQETISDNISKTLESPTFGRGKSKKKRRDMAIAASYRKAGKSRKTLSQSAMKKH